MTALIYVGMSLATMFIIGYWMAVGKIKHTFDNSGEFSCFCGIAGVVWPLTWSIMCAGFIYGMIKDIVKRG